MFDSGNKNALVVLVLTVFCAVSTFFSFQSYSLSKRMQKEHGDTIRSLQANLQKLQAQVGGTAQKSGSTQSGTKFSWDSKPRPFKPSGGQAAGPSGDHAAYAPDSSPAADVPPYLGGPLTPAVVSDYRTGLFARKSQLHQADESRYGRGVTDLYEKARARGKSAQESDEAFDQLQQQYPDSNSTAIAAAERALESAMNGKTEQVEKLYDMLSKNDNASSIVTEQGVEAMPALMTYLTMRYLQEGRTDAAEAMLSNLEGGYGTSLVAIPGPNGQPEYKSVNEVIQQMRENPQSAPPPPGGGPQPK
ncbi:MAG: hypothetical protein ACLGPL_02695 [Acidobacteriota bacterium]